MVKFASVCKAGVHYLLIETIGLKFALSVPYANNEGKDGFVSKTQAIWVQFLALSQIALA